MPPDQLDQNARKNIRLLGKVLGKMLAKQGFKGAPDLKKTWDLCVILDGAIEVGEPDKASVEAWLQAFLDCNIPSQLVDFAVSARTMAFPLQAPGSDYLAVHTQRLLLGAWESAQCLLSRIGFQLAARPPPRKDLGKAVLDQLLPSPGEASK